MAKFQAPWLKYKHCVLAADALGEGHMRFVGGAVRNSLMGIDASDIDIATSHIPHDAQRRLEGKGFKVIPTGIEHGTITAVLDGEHLEITTLRRDVETDGRHAKVVFTDEWEADAARRDFTMNAIYVSIDGTLYDPFDGLEDIKAGRVRFIGNADERIKEDALRILRLFRIHAYFGQDSLDEKDLAAAISNMGLLKGLSMERIASELFKILKSSQAAEVLGVMDASGILPILFPNILPNFDKLLMVQGMGEAQTQALRNLLALYQGEAVAMGKKLKLSNKECDHLASTWALVNERHVLEEQIWKECIYRRGMAPSLDALLLTHANVDSRLYSALRSWDIASFPIRGSDLMALGIKSGPEIGDILQEKETKWIASGFALSKAELLAGITP